MSDSQDDDDRGAEFGKLELKAGHRRREVKAPDLKQLGLGDRDLFVEAMNVDIRKKFDEYRRRIEAMSKELAQIYASIPKPEPDADPLVPAPLPPDGFVLLNMIARQHNSIGELADATFSLEDAVRRTLVGAHSAYLKFVIEENDTRDVNSKIKFDNFTISQSRMHDRVSKQQRNLQALTNVVRALVYLMSEQKQFPSDITEYADHELGPQALFEQHFSNYQKDTQRIYEHRLGIEYDRGVAGDMILVGQAYTKVFNLKKCQSLNLSSISNSLVTSSSPA